MFLVDEKSNQRNNNEDDCILIEGYFEIYLNLALIEINNNYS